MLLKVFGAGCFVKRNSSVVLCTFGCFSQMLGYGTINIFVCKKIGFSCTFTNHCHNIFVVLKNEFRSRIDFPAHFLLQALCEKLVDQHKN